MGLVRVVWSRGDLPQWLPGRLIELSIVWSEQDWGCTYLMTRNYPASPIFLHHPPSPHCPLLPHPETDWWIG